MSKFTYIKASTVWQNVAYSLDGKSWRCVARQMGFKRCNLTSLLFCYKPVNGSGVEIFALLLALSSWSPVLRVLWVLTVIFSSPQAVDTDRRAPLRWQLWHALCKDEGEENMCCFVECILALTIWRPSVFLQLPPFNNNNTEILGFQFSLPLVIFWSWCCFKHIF